MEIGQKALGLRGEKNRKKELTRKEEDGIIQERPSKGRENMREWRNWQTR